MGPSYFSTALVASHTCGVALFCTLLLSQPVAAQSIPSLDERSAPAPAEVSYAATELRNATAPSLRSWFANCGDEFPLNVEFVASPRTGGIKGYELTPKWPGLIVSSGKITLSQVIKVSTKTLGAVVHEDPSGTNLVFRAEPMVANPFDLTVNTQIQGTFTFEQALTELQIASNVDLIPFSRFPISDTSRQLLMVSVPPGTTLRVALNTITRVWGCHWSALIIGDLDGSELAKAVNSGQNALVTAQFFWPARK